SSQGTVASFVLTLSGFPPGFPSVFPTLSDRFRSDFLGAFQFFALAFPLRRFPFRRSKLYQGFSVSLTSRSQACEN
ncbi:hypothetical protein, partial [Streptomyces sp. NPDC004286]|uniref:hypothetical protein n=1 Tax=Streptomyces sp. NPDC004286 TaxID=3364696 RepID=UPI00368FA5AC